MFHIQRKITTMHALLPIRLR